MPDAQGRKAYMLRPDMWSELILDRRRLEGTRRQQYASLLMPAYVGAAAMW